MFSLRVSGNFDSIPSRCICDSIYGGIYGGTYCGDTFLIRIRTVVTNSLTALAGVVVGVIITSIDISRLILFEALFFKTNIKKAVNSLCMIFYNVFI